MKAGMEIVARLNLLRWKVTIFLLMFGVVALVGAAAASGATGAEASAGTTTTGLQFDLLCNPQGIFDFDTKIPHAAFQLGMSE